MLSFVDEMTLLLCFAFEAGVCGAMGQGTCPHRGAQGSGCRPAIAAVK